SPRCRGRRRGCGELSGPRLTRSGRSARSCGRPSRPRSAVAGQTTRTARPAPETRDGAAARHVWAGRGSGCARRAAESPSRGAGGPPCTITPGPQSGSWSPATFMVRASPWPEIARLLGYRDHTVVLYLARRTEEAGCFTDDAAVTDEGRTWHGHAEIRRWRENVATAYEYTLGGPRSRTRRPGARARMAPGADPPGRQLP